MELVLDLIHKVNSLQSSVGLLTFFIVADLILTWLTLFFVARMIDRTEK